MRKNNFLYGLKDTEGSLKLQEMTFVLVAIMIFFVLIAVFFVVVRGSELGKSAQELRDERASAAVRTLAGMPELMWAGCSNCIDGDKAFLLKERLKNNSTRKGLFSFSYLALERVYPSAEGECIPANYPRCKTTTIIKESENYGIAYGAYVNICYWDRSISEIRCDLGRIIASGGDLNG